MASAYEVKLRINPTRRRAVVGKLSADALARAGEITANRYRRNITADGLVNSGRMLAGVQTKPDNSNPEAPTVTIGTDAKYAHFPDQGTRAHGPVRARFMRFQPKGSSVFVFAKWVRGVRAHHFSRRALDELRPTDFT